MSPRTSVTQALASLWVDASQSDDCADATLALICAVEEWAKARRADRLEMDIYTNWHCNDCGRPWTVRCTVKRERETRPDNCPDCFGPTSCWHAHGWLYVGGAK